MPCPTRFGFAIRADPAAPMHNDCAGSAVIEARADAPDFPHLRKLAPFTLPRAAYSRAHPRRREAASSAVNLRRMPQFNSGVEQWHAGCFLGTAGGKNSFKRRKVMGGKSDEIKGRVKEAAGAITDDDKLRREGQADQTKGKVKQSIDRAADKAKEVVDNVTKK
jgi:uncharacterized protein YjbJ (UPF0337 family)